MPLPWVLIGEVGRKEQGTSAVSETEHAETHGVYNYTSKKLTRIHAGRSCLNKAVGKLRGKARTLTCLFSSSPGLVFRSFPSRKGMICDKRT